MEADRDGVRYSGGCLCGAVRYDVRGPMRAPVACHCGQCRRQSGGLWTATAARREHVSVHDEAGQLAWYRSSAGARRGFCRACGSNLFWDGEDRPYLAITAGSLDQPTGLRLAAHIFTDDKADFYELPADGLPRLPGGLQGLTLPEA